MVAGLTSRGHTATILSRRTTGSIEDPEAVAKACAGVDGVVIAVESGVDSGSARAVHFDGVRNVVAAAAPGTHLVLVTQIYITRATEHPDMAPIIEWRARGEEAVRASGLPYTIVRPSWLTDGPVGGVTLAQGDTGDGRVSRETVAEVCVQALLNPAARGKTTELYGTHAAPVTGWNAAFAALQPDA